MHSRIEHLREHRVEAVEHDLWQAEPGEGCGQRELLFGEVARGVDLDDPWRTHDGQHRGSNQDQPNERDQAVGVAIATVGIGAHMPHKLRNEDRIQGTTNHQDVDDVRQRVSEGVSVGQDRKT